MHESLSSSHCVCVFLKKSEKDKLLRAIICDSRDFVRVTEMELGLLQIEHFNAGLFSTTFVVVSCLESFMVYHLALPLLSLPFLPVLFLFSPSFPSPRLFFHTFTFPFSLSFLLSSLFYSSFPSFSLSFLSPLAFLSPISSFPVSFLLL